VSHAQDARAAFASSIEFALILHSVVYKPCLKSLKAAPLIHTGLQPGDPRPVNDQKPFQRFLGWLASYFFGLNRPAVCQESKPLKRFHTSLRAADHRANARYEWEEELFEF